MSFFTRLFIFVLILMGMILFGGLLPVIARSETLPAKPDMPSCLSLDRASLATAFLASPTPEICITPNIFRQCADSDRASTETGSRLGFIDEAVKFALETLELCSKNSQGPFSTS